MLDLRGVMLEHLASGAHRGRRHAHPGLPPLFDRTATSAVFARAEGAYLYDLDGRRTLDLLAGGGLHWLGRNHPAVNAALADVLALDVPNVCVVNASVLGALLEQRLLALAGPGHERVVFATSRAGALATAVRAARTATGRWRVLSLRANPGPTLEDDGGFLGMRAGDWTALRRELGRGDVAALVYEGLQGPLFEAVPPAWIRQAEAAAREAGTWLVADESLTGLGRCGSWLMAAQIGVKPDAVVLGEALSGGQVPMAAVLLASGRRCADAEGLAENNLAMAAGLATVAALEELDAPRRANELGEALRNGLRDLARRWDCIDRVSGKGLLVGVHFRTSAARLLRLQQALVGMADAGSFAAALHVDLHRRGRVIVQVAPGVDGVALLPPIVTERRDVDVFLDALDETLAGFYGYGGPVVNLGRAVARDAVRAIRK